MEIQGEADKSNYLLEEIMERTWSLVDLRAELWAIRGPWPLPCPWNIHFTPPFPQCKLCSRIESWERKVLLRPLPGCGVWNWIQLRPLYRLLRLVGAEFHLPFSCQRQASYESLLLIKPATCQSWRVCLLLGLSLPPCNRDQFKNQHYCSRRFQQNSHITFATDKNSKDTGSLKT